VDVGSEGLAKGLTCLLPPLTHGPEGVWLGFECQVEGIILVSVTVEPLDGKEVVRILYLPSQRAKGHYKQAHPQAFLGNSCQQKSFRGAAALLAGEGHHRVGFGSDEVVLHGATVDAREGTAA